jgi:hypothetical protein
MHNYVIEKRAKENENILCNELHQINTKLHQCTPNKLPEQKIQWPRANKEALGEIHFSCRPPRAPRHQRAVLKARPAGRSGAADDDGADY